MSQSRKLQRKVERASGQADAALAIYADATVREVYAAHVVMMAAGVDTADIYVQVAMVANATPPGVYATVIAKGNGQEYRYWTMPLPTKRHIEAFEAAWHRFSYEQPRMKKDVLDALVAESHTMRQYKVPILAGLLDKGIGDGPPLSMMMGVN